jgi:hypothetical protein
MVVLLEVPVLLAVLVLLEVLTWRDRLFAVTERVI